MEERRDGTRIFFGTQKWNACVVIPRDALDIETPSFITAWDLSVSGFSFVTDVSFKLNTGLDVLLTHPQLEKTLAIVGKVVRVDQIRELDNPSISYKIALRFDTIDAEFYEQIRGLTE